MKDRTAPMRIKRFLDIVIALLCLVVFAPLLCGIALAVLVSMGRPVIFRQQRTGYKGRPFILYKFRSMLEPGDPRAKGISDEDRLTRLGAFLRSTSLDELPSLWNVLRGEMSLVGPRPLPVRYLHRYTKEQLRRHDVPPGITGWAAVNGRNALTWSEKFALDLWYVDNWSLWLDLKILFKTIVIVLKREGISAKGFATAPEFLGTEQENQKSSEPSNPSTQKPLLSGDILYSQRAHGYSEEGKEYE